jgi:hypothetical protein
MMMIQGRRTLEVRRIMVDKLEESLRVVSSGRGDSKVQLGESNFWVR